jgi:RimJ/RimL family protein N-acetyltransferase
MLETKRLIIKDFEIDYINDFMDYRNNLVWMKFQGFKGLAKKEYEDNLLREFALEKGMQLAIVKKSNMKLIGDLYLRLEKRTLVIGYTINPLYSRKNYISEACLALIEWSKVNKIEKLKAEVNPQNLASIAVLNKLKFRYTKQNEFDLSIYELIL